jgi:hypothetical protein
VILPAPMQMGLLLLLLLLLPLLSPALMAPVQ